MRTPFNLFSDICPSQCYCDDVTFVWRICLISLPHFLVFIWNIGVQKRHTRNFGGGLRRGGGGEVIQKSLSEAHGHCMLQCFAPQWRDACPSPHVTVRGTTQLRGARYVRGAGERGRHSGEMWLVEVGLQARTVGGQAVGQSHGVWWRAWTETALWQRLWHARLTAEGRRELQLGHPRHSGSPAGVVSVKGAQAVLHGGRGGELR